MNKTPIQELIWLMCDGTDNIDESVKISEVWDWAHKWIQKEKQFAFECFEAGKKFGGDTILPPVTSKFYPEIPNFEQFYSQYEEK